MNAEEVAGESRQRQQRCPLHPGTGCIERRNGATRRRIRLRMLQAALATAWDGSPKGRDSRAGSVHDSPGSRREVARVNLPVGKKYLKAPVFIVLVVVLVVVLAVALAEVVVVAAVVECLEALLSCPPP